MPSASYKAHSYTTCALPQRISQREARGSGHAGFVYANGVIVGKTHECEIARKTEALRTKKNITANTVVKLRTSGRTEIKSMVAVCVAGHFEHDVALVVRVLTKALLRGSFLCIAPYLCGRDDCPQWLRALPVREKGDATIRKDHEKKPDTLYTCKKRTL